MLHSTRHTKFTLDVKTPVSPKSRLIWPLWVATNQSSQCQHQPQHQPSHLGWCLKQRTLFKEVLSCRPGGHHWSAPSPDPVPYCAPANQEKVWQADTAHQVRAASSLVESLSRLVGVSVLVTFIIILQFRDNIQPLPRLWLSFLTVKKSAGNSKCLETHARNETDARQ